MKTKKYDYKKEQEKEKKKTILKYILSGVGLTMLLTAFIGLTCLGVKSCNKKQSSNNSQEVNRDINGINNKVAREDYQYHYYYRNNSFIAMEQDLNDIGIYQEGDYFVNDIDISLKIVDTTLTEDNGYYTHVNSMRLEVVDTYHDEYILYGSYNGQDILYYCEQADLVESNIQIGYIDSNIDLYDLNNDNAVLRYFALLMRSNSSINLNKTFTFNNQINRYAPLLQSNSTFATYSATSQLGTKQVIRGYFIDSSGNTYIGINITYMQAQASGYIDDNGDYKVWELTGAQFINLEYIRTDNTTISVNIANYIQQDNKICYTKTSNWVADSFRTIKIIYLDNINSGLPLTSGNYKPLEVLQAFNNNSIGLDGGFEETNNVFDLLGSAFKSVASILNMQVLPYITLGTLIFVPFSIMILISVVWLFKR